MPELNNIQTYEKLKGSDFKPTLERFSKVLNRIGLWNNEIKNAFESFEWKIEDDGYVYSSINAIGSYPTRFSDIKVRPLVVAWTPAIDESFEENWISCDLLIESENIRNHINGYYKDIAFPLVKKLVKEMSIEFYQTGIYFTDEAQDGRDFNGIRTNGNEELWSFDYALIPNKLTELYRDKPYNYGVNKTDNWIESWNLENWKVK